MQPDPELEELAQVHPLDVFHDHEVAVVLLALIDDLDDVGMPQPHPGLGLLVEPQHGLGNRARTGVRRTLIATGEPVSLLPPAVDPGEGPLGQVEQRPVVAVEEARGIALLEPLELPARQPPLAHQDAEQGLARAVVGLGPGLAILVARDQPDQRQLIDQRFDVDFGHGKQS